MVSHESLAGHGHVQAAWLEAIGLVHDGGSDIGSGERVCHWTLPLVLALACVFVFGIAGRPFAPISLNMCFVLHACAGH